MSLGRLAILGAGNSGCAAAAHMAIKGYEVRLFNRSAERLAPIVQSGGIELVGILGSDKVPIACITTDMAEAVRDCDLVMVVAPAFAHAYFARLLAPLLSNGTTVLLNPGHTGGALHFMHEIILGGCRARVTVCEVNTNAYICRMTGPARVAVYNLAKSLLFAAYPAREGSRVLEQVRPMYPNLIPVGSVLETGLSNLNAIMHPPMVLLNVGWIEHTKGDFTIYSDAATPGVGVVIGRVDEERLAVARALGLDVAPFAKLFYDYGATTLKGVDSGSVVTALLESEPNRLIKAPSSTTHRYVEEDIPYGLVPISSLGKWAGLETPVIDSLITLASAVNRVDYRSKGLTVDAMGISALGVTELHRLLQDGPRF